MITRYPSWDRTDLSDRLNHSALSTINARGPADGVEEVTYFRLPAGVLSLEPDPVAPSSVGQCLAAVEEKSSPASWELPWRSARDRPFSAASLTMASLTIRSVLAMQ